VRIRAPAPAAHPCVGQTPGVGRRTSDDRLGIGRDRGRRALRESDLQWDRLLGLEWKGSIGMRLPEELSNSRMELTGASRRPPG